MELVKDSTRLKEIFAYRWLKQDNESETYLVIVNTSGRDIRPGEQVYYNYGRRTNTDLLLK